jgi:hypothetical protein
VTADGAAPHGTPHLPARIVEGLKAAVAEPDRRAGAYVHLAVAGGVHGEHYEFEYRVDAHGRATGRLHDELHGRSVAARELEADPERFRALAEGIDVAALLGAGESGHGALPDSVIGRLEISDGEQTVRWRFLPDREQAEPLRRAVDLVYESAAKALAEERLRP